jgi:hypothetical protein
MFKLRSGFIFPVILLVSAFLGCQSSQQKSEYEKAAAVSATKAAPVISNQDLKSVAESAYIFGYPLVVMDVTKDVQTNVAQANADGDAPINQFSHKTEFPDDTFNTVVSPNADTLYSSAWLDLYREPMVLSLPDTGKRYYLMPILSAWSDVIAAPGTRTTGNGRQDFAVTGPGWTGTLPAGVKQIKSPTNEVWIVGRTQTNGKEDYGAVRELQRQFRLTPLSAWGTSYRPPMAVPVRPGVDMTTAPVAQVERLSGVNFFKRMAESMIKNPPKPEDRAEVARLAKMGIVPGRTFDTSNFTAEQLAALNEGAKAGLQKIVSTVKDPKNVQKKDGWVYMFDIGRYGTRYTRRAEIAKFGLGANMPQDAIYPRASTDSMGRPLNGQYRYTMRFSKGNLPPAGAFWSLSMYNNKQFFVKNPINRFAIGDRDRLQYGRDGSLELYIQKDRPEERAKVANWLPAPEGDFNLIMRLYRPKAAALNGQWRVPGVQRVEEVKKLSQVIETLQAEMAESLR